MKKLMFLMVLALVSILAACGSDNSSSSFTPRSYSGTLSGSSTGTFNYTVNDSYGNISGNATLAGKNMTLTGTEYSNNTVVLDFNDSKYFGTMTGTKLNFRSWQKYVTCCNY